MPSCSVRPSPLLSLVVPLVLLVALARAFIARYLFRPPLAAKSRGDGKRRHGNFVTVFFRDDENVPVDRRVSYFSRERERGERRVIYIGIAVYPHLHPIAEEARSRPVQQRLIADRVVARAKHPCKLAFCDTLSHLRTPTFPKELFD